MIVKFMSFKKYAKRDADGNGDCKHILFFTGGDGNEYSKAKADFGMLKNYIIVPIGESSWFLDIKESCDSIKTGRALHVFVVIKNGGKWKQAIVNNLFKRFYTFDKYMTSNTDKEEQQFYIVDECTDKPKCMDMIAKLECSNIARDLATEPANKMYPDAFCKYTKELFKGHKNANVIVMDVQDMKKKGLNLVLGVGVSAKHDPRFLVIEIKSGNKNAENICVLGKGVVFDSGGYDIKSGASMINMKGDKTGGAIAVGILHYLSKSGLKLRHNLIGIVPLVENLVSHKSHKHGDVLTSYNGKTVELLNMDAEGRLILADALAYACDIYKPRWILDFATLTGWASSLHCDTSYIYFTTNDNVSSYLQKIGEAVGERSIRLPNWPEYTKYTKGRLADYKNHGFSCQKSNGFMAAMFLMNFVEERYRNRWVHIDITHSHNNNGLHNCNSMATGIEMVKKIAT